jgi:hypothetical protein
MDGLRCLVAVLAMEVIAGAQGRDCQDAADGIYRKRQKMRGGR